MDLRDDKELPKPAEPLEDETTARRRSRRVSFADTTDVHVFYRDEDYETPPDLKPGSESSSGFGLGSEPLGFRGDQSASDESSSFSRQEEDGDGEEEEEEEEEQEPFVKNMDLSPGSTVGSVTSNEGNGNLFGPVSSSFIRSGRLSEASDDNIHDITLDSTAFSLHFQNVLPSDDLSVNSGRSLLTLTGESKPSSTGSFMSMTEIKSPIPRHMPSGWASSGRTGDSNDMSLIVENSQKHEYGKPTPMLEAFLAQIDQSIECKTPKSVFFSRHSDDVINMKDTVDEEPRTIGSGLVPADVNGGFIDSQALSGSSAMVVADQIGLINGVAGTKESPSTAKSGIFSSMDKESSKDGLEEDQSHIFANACNPDVLSPTGTNSQRSLRTQDYHAHHQTSESKWYPNSSPISALKVPVLVAAGGGEQILESFKGEIHTPIIHTNSDEHFQSLLNGSISSLRAKRQQLFVDPSISLQGVGVSNSAAGQSRSSLNVEVIRHGERISAIKNSISKLKSLETPTYRVINSKSSLLGHNNMLLEFEAVSNKSKNYDTDNSVDMSVTAEEKYLRNTTEKRQRMELDVQNNSGLMTPNNLGILRYIRENEAIGETGKVTEASLPSHIPRTAMKMKRNPPPSHNPIEGVSTPPVPGIYTKPKAVDPMESRQGPKASYNLLSSPVKVLGQRSSVCLDGHFNPRSKGVVESSSFVEESRAWTPISNIFVGSCKMDVQNQKKMSDNNIIFCDIQKETSISGNCLFGSQDHDADSRKDPNSNSEKLSESDPKASLHESASPDVYKGRTLTKESASPINTGAKLSEKDPTAASYEFASLDAYIKSATTKEFMKRSVEPTAQSPIRECDYSLENNILHPCHPTTSDFPKSTQESTVFVHSEGHHILQTSEKSFPIPYVDIVGKKRTSEEIFRMDKDHINKTDRTSKSPKIVPELECSSTGCSSDHVVSNSQACKEGVLAPFKHWTEILSKMSASTDWQFPPSIDKLNFQLDIMEDMLDELQKARKYERLCSDIQSSRKAHHSGDQYEQRVAKARLLQDMLLYKRAKLQLKCVKLDGLHKKAEQLQSDMQECHKLKSSLLQNPVTRDANKEKHLDSILTYSNNNHQKEQNRVTSMSQEYEMLEKKLKDLMSSFETSCKIKGNMNCNEIIKIVNDHIGKRSHCRLIRQDLQLWKLADVVKQNDQYEILLNYCDLLSQRFTIQSVPASSFVVHNTFDYVKIAKRFPNMNVSTAFEFVLSPKGDHRLHNSKCLQQETQATSFILGNLLDVLVELKAAQLEIPNLICSSFYSLSAGQLELRLSFLSFKSGGKMTLSLDITDLNCAVYPSEPSELEIQISSTPTMLPPSISDEIMSAIRSLSGGRPMFVSLCRCISQVLRISDW